MVLMIRTVMMMLFVWLLMVSVDTTQAPTDFHFVAVWLSKVADKVVHSAADEEVRI